MKAAAAGKTVIAVTLVVLLPGLVLTALGLADLAGISALVAIAAAIPTMRVRPALGLIAAGVLGVSSLLAVPAATHALSAGLLMAVVAALAGSAARFGTSGAVTMTPIALDFMLVEPVQLADGDVAGAFVVAAAVLGSALWAVGVATLLARGHDREPLVGHAWSRSGPYAALLAVVAGGAMAVVVANGLGHGGGWFVMTLLIVIQPYVLDSMRKTVQRGGGTLIGFLVALVVGEIVRNPTVLYVVGGLFALLAVHAMVVAHRPYWQYVSVLTPAIVLLEGTSTNVVDTAWQRLLFTLLGVGIAVLIELAVYPVARSWARRTGADRY